MKLKIILISLYCFLTFSFSYAIEYEKDISIRNYVVVRVWKPTIGKTPIDTSYIKTSYLGSVVAKPLGGNVGHVSLEIVENKTSINYISFWPEKKLISKEGSGKCFNNFDDDCSAEGNRQQEKERLPEFTKKLYSLNRNAIVEEFKKIEGNNYNFSIWEPSGEGSLFNPGDVFNCSSLSLHLLKKGGIADLFPDRPWYWGKSIRYPLSFGRLLAYTAGGGILGMAMSGNPVGIGLGGLGGIGTGVKDCQDTYWVSQEKDDDLANYLVNPIQIANLTDKASKIEEEKYNIEGKKSRMKRRTMYQRPIAND